MQLCATLTLDDFRSVIDEITPLRVEIRPRRPITIGRPKKVELVAGAGLRVRGDACFTWDVGALPIRVKLRAWQVLLVPSFIAGRGGHVLAFEPVLEELDFERVPLFIDSRIADAMKRGLAAHKHKLVWDFAKHLSLTRPTPKPITPGGELTLAPMGGSVTVTATEVRLTLTFRFRAARDAASASLREGAAPPAEQTIVA